jgi:anaerobic magnesium-protoporphyrin IX monomethyl ester cyclase
MTVSPKVLIVVPRFINKPGDFYQFPLGLAYIAAAIKNAGFSVAGLNLNYSDKDEVEAVREYVADNSIDVVMSGGLSPFLPSIDKIFSGARLANESVLVVAGGGVVSGDPVAAHKLMKIDIGVIGEGEEAVVEILEEYKNQTNNYGDIKGIVYKENDQVKQTPSRNAIKDLNSIAWPLFEIFDIEKHINNQNPLDHHFFQNNVDNNPRSIDMITSRSCPFMCTFCFHPVGKTYRERSVDDVIAELKWYI